MDRAIRKIVEEKGFTIVELIVVIVLAGILSYVALSEFSTSTSSIKQMTLAKKIVADVRFAQETALNHKATVHFLVETAQNRYSLKWDDGTYLKTPMGGRDYIVDIANSDFAGVTITASNFSSGLLSFNSEGNPLNNGSPLSSLTSLIVLDNQIHIKITPGTGRCYIQD